MPFGKQNRATTRCGTRKLQVTKLPLIGNKRQKCNMNDFGSHLKKQTVLENDVESSTFRNLKSSSKRHSDSMTSSGRHKLDETFDVSLSNTQHDDEMHHNVTDKVGIDESDSFSLVPNVSYTEPSNTLEQYTAISSAKKIECETKPIKCDFNGNTEFNICDNEETFLNEIYNKYIQNNVFVCCNQFMTGQSLDVCQESDDLEIAEEVKTVSDYEEQIEKVSEVLISSLSKTNLDCVPEDELRLAAQLFDFNISNPSDRNDVTGHREICSENHAAHTRKVTGNKSDYNGSDRKRLGIQSENRSYQFFKTKNYILSNFNHSTASECNQYCNSGNSTVDNVKDPFDFNCHESNSLSASNKLKRKRSNMFYHLKKTSLTQIAKTGFRKSVKNKINMHLTQGDSKVADIQYEEIKFSYVENVEKPLIKENNINSLDDSYGVPAIIDGNLNLLKVDSESFKRPSIIDYGTSDDFIPNLKRNKCDLDRKNDIQAGIFKNEFNSEFRFSLLNEPIDHKERSKFCDEVYDLFYQAIQDLNSSPENGNLNDAGTESTSKCNLSENENVPKNSENKNVLKKCASPTDLVELTKDAVEHRKYASATNENSDYNVFNTLESTADLGKNFSKINYENFSSKTQSDDSSVRVFRTKFFKSKGCASELDIENKSKHLSVSDKNVERHSDTKNEYQFESTSDRINFQMRSFKRKICTYENNHRKTVTIQPSRSYEKTPVESWLPPISRVNDSVEFTNRKVGAENLSQNFIHFKQNSVTDDDYASSKIPSASTNKYKIFLSKNDSGSGNHILLNSRKRDIPKKKDNIVNSVDNSLMYDKYLDFTEVINLVTDSSEKCTSELGTKSTSVSVTSKENNDINISVSTNNSSFLDGQYLETSDKEEKLYSLLTEDICNYIENAVKKKKCGNTILLTIQFKEGFCQLNEPTDISGKENFIPSGIMMLFKTETDLPHFYYLCFESLLHENKPFYRYFFSKILSTLNKNICFKAKKFVSLLMKYFNYLPYEVCSKWNLIDPLVGCWLLDPNTPDRNFSEIVKRFGIYQNGKTYNNSLNQTCQLLDSLFVISTKLFDELEETDLTKIFLEMEMKILPILAVMEFRGIFVKNDELQDLHSRIMIAIENLEEIVKKKKYLEDLDLPSIISQLHNLDNIRLTLTQVSKYNEDISHLRTTWNQFSSCGGCLPTCELFSQINSNVCAPRYPLLNLKSVFSPRPGYTFVKASYNLVAFRVLVHLAGDPVFLQMFQEGYYTVLPSSAECDNGLQELKEEVKYIFLAMILGIEKPTQAHASNVIGKAAEEILKLLEVRHRLDFIVKECMKNSELKSLCGRRKTFDNCKSSTKLFELDAVKQATCFMIQSGVADIYKAAVLCIESSLANKADLDAHLLSMTETGLLWEVRCSNVQLMKNIMIKAMEDPSRNLYKFSGVKIQFSLPFPVNVTVNEM